jgi:hypothetical protein
MAGEDETLGFGHGNGGSGSWARRPVQAME